MKRDMELVRKILIKIGNHQDGSYDDRVVIDGFERELVDYHLEIMHEAGLLSGNIRYADGGIIFSSLNLSWEGNDYLVAIANESIWSKTKSGIKSKGLELGAVPFSVLKDYAIMQGKDLLGLS